jgi:hypothetical protein
MGPFGKKLRKYCYDFFAQKHIFGKSLKRKLFSKALSNIKTLFSNTIPRLRDHCSTDFGVGVELFSI